MSRALRIFVGVIFLLALLPAAAGPVAAQATPPNDPLCSQSGGVFTTDANGAVICYWVPPLWNRDLIIFAHGYVDPRMPVGIPWDQLMINGTSLPQTVNLLGYAFAVTSYRKNGLAVKEGVEDVFNLVKVFKTAKPFTRRVFIVGASEGGLVTTLALEKDTHNQAPVFSGGMSTCGPVGDFAKQVNYWGDFRLVFDHYFPQAILPYVMPPIPNPAINIQPQIIAGWDTPNPQPNPATPGPLQASVINALQGNVVDAGKLIALTQAAVDPADPNTIGLTTLGILGYNVLSTDEARVELSRNPNVDLNTNAGSPYDNTGRSAYFDPVTGPFTVPGYAADPAAIAAILADYTTTGKIRAPLVDLHTTLDPIVPFWHEGLYRLKTIQAGTAFKFIDIPVNRYGHCNFKISEAIFGLVVMIFRGTFGLTPIAVVKGSLPDAASQDEFQAMMDAHRDLFSGGFQVFLPSVNQ